jgi:hypothetical protein
MFWRFDPEPNVTREADSYPGMPLTERTLKGPPEACHRLVISALAPAISPF